MKVSLLFYLGATALILLLSSEFLGGQLLAGVVLLAFVVVVSIGVIAGNIQFQRTITSARNDIGDIERALSGYKTYERYLRNKDKVLLLERTTSLISELSKLKGSVWYRHLVITTEFDSLLVRAEAVRAFIGGFLMEYAKKETERHRTLFDRANLDDQQKLAIVMDDEYNLIEAAAGSGKTRTLTARIALLVERGVPADEILALAYTNDAADEMSQRLGDQYGITGANVMTLHSFSRRIARRSPRFRSGVASREKQGEFIRLGAEKLSAQDRDFAAKLLAFALELKEAEELTESEFPTAAHYYEYLRKQEYETLSRKKVKSIAERDIGNFLFLNGIEFEYESPLEWADRSIERRDYQPDFFLPEYNLWLEHWAVDREGNVPEWFSKGGSVSPSERYRKGMEYKRDQFRTHNQKLLETYYYQWTEGNLTENLRTQLEANGVVLKPMAMDEILARIDGLIRRDPLYELMFSFISKGKTAGLGADDLAARVSASGREWTRRQKSFASLMIPIWREYESQLEENNMLDFGDMVTLALEVAREDEGELARLYTQVLVDEFQDITDPQLGLIQCLMQDPSEKSALYCVGDHRQSIFSFAGSNVYNIIDFDKRFSLPEKAVLSSNYRCPKNVVEASNMVMAAGNQKDEPAIPALNFTSQIHLLEEDDVVRYEEWEAAKAKEIIEEILRTKQSTEDVMVLARYNFRLEPLRVAFPDQRNQRLSFHSIHSAKGTEADYVLVLGCIGGRNGFPSSVMEENLLDVVNVRKQNKKEKLDEERRLFYVALTRCRKQLFLFTSRTERSQFLLEIAAYLGLPSPTKKLVSEQESVQTPRIHLPARPSAVKFCVHCGASVAAPGVFCSNCGSRISDTSGKNHFVGARTSPTEDQATAIGKSYSAEAVRAKHARAYAKWDSTEDQVLTTEFRTNLSIETIAQRHQRKPNAIRSRLRKLGLIK